MYFEVRPVDEHGTEGDLLDSFLAEGYGKDQKIGTHLARAPRQAPQGTRGLTVRVHFTDIDIAAGQR